jgi:hypothetical protein
MSLDYRLSQGMTNDDIKEEDWDTFQSIVFGTMNFGAQIDTKEHVDLYYQRALMTYAALYQMKPPYTLEELSRYQGMTTNASRETDAAFKKKLWNQMLENTAFRVKQEREMAEKAGADNEL